MKFYKCNKCGNIFEVINDAAIVPSCCKEHMEILEANTNEEGSKEKQHFVMSSRTEQRQEFLTAFIIIRKNRRIKRKNS